MKKIFSVFLLFLFLLIISQLFVTSVRAQETCGNMTLSPNTVQRLAPVTVTITGASSSYFGKNVYIAIYRSSDQTLVSNGTGTITIGANGNGQATLFKGVLYDPGSYFIVVSSTPISSVNAKDANRCSNFSNLQVVGQVPELKPAGAAPDAAASDVNCITKDGVAGINTAIGCIPISDQNALVGFFLRWGLGIGGGIAFLLLLFSGFQIMTSRGDPNRLKAGQEMMTSAIAGLLLLIFSLVILRIIGLNILDIPIFK